MGLAIAVPLGIHLFNAATFAPENFIEVEHGLTAIAFSADGTSLAVASPHGGIELVRTSDATVEATLKSPPTSIDSVTFSSDGQLVAGGAADGAVYVWQISVQTPQHILSGHTGRVHSLAFSSDGKILFSGSDDRTVRVWNVTDWKLSQMMAVDAPTLGVMAASPDGKLVATGTLEGRIQVWRVLTGKPIQTLLWNRLQILGLAFSPDSTMLAITSEDASTVLRRVPDGALIRILTGHASSVNSAAFSPDGKRLIMSDGTDQVSYLDPVTLKTSGQITVRDDRGPVKEINELEYIPAGATGGSLGGPTGSAITHHDQIAALLPGDIEDCLERLVVANGHDLALHLRLRGLLPDHVEYASRMRCGGRVECLFRIHRQRNVVRQQHLRAVGERVEFRHHVHRMEARVALLGELHGTLDGFFRKLRPVGRNEYLLEHVGHLRLAGGQSVTAPC